MKICLVNNLTTLKSLNGVELSNLKKYMPNFFSSILKNKTILFFAFLVIIVSSLALPTIILAKEQNWDNNKIDIIGELQRVPDQGDANTLGKLAWISQLEVGIGQFVVRSAFDLTALSDIALSYILGNIVLSPITIKNPSTNVDFTGAWASIRDLANMLIVLGFVIIGIATALRIRAYEAKSLLWKLVLVALFVNFSGLFCGLIIDMANFVMGGLNGGTGIMAQNITEKVRYSSFNMLTAPLATADPGHFMMYSAMWAAVYLGVAFTFLYLSVILIARYAILIMLFILSPLAFAFWVYPASQHLWSEWWNTFLKWAFVGVFGSFALWITGQIIATSPALMPDNNLTNITPTNVSSIFIALFIVLMFLYVGFKMTSQKTGLAAMAGKAVMGLAKGATGLAMGTVAGASRLTGLTGAATRVGQGLKDRVTGASEKYLGKFSPVKQGTTEANRAKRLDEPTKRLDAIQNNEQLAKIAEQRPITAQQSADKAAAAQLLAKRNAFDKVDPSKRDAVMAHAQAFGVSKDTFTKGMPTVGATATNAEAKEKIMNDRANVFAQLNPGMSAKDARAQAEGTTVTNEDMANAHTEMRQQRITENALGLSPVTDRDVSNKAKDDTRKRYQAQGISPRRIDDYMQVYKPSDSEKGMARESLSQERVQKGIQKLDVAGIRSAPKELLSHPDFIKNVGAQRLDRAMLEMSQDKVKELKKHTDMASPEGSALFSHMADLETRAQAGDQAAYKEWAELVDKAAVIQGA